MSDDIELIDPAQLIEHDDHIIRFKAQNISAGGSDGEVIIQRSAMSFKQTNEAGQLRPLASVEEACKEGQLVAKDLQAFISRRAV